MVNIRKRAGRRKQKPVRHLYSPSKRVRCLFGILGRLEHPRGLEGLYRLTPPEREDGHLRTMGVGVAIKGRA